mmetsp:Transcript_3070/g.8682  ORF Transcript_3070/g.8682 Transcript_3070/m.8682 type:complete len:247 (+) Transcript_3070:354-1094(+)
MFTCGVYGVSATDARWPFCMATSLRRELASASSRRHMSSSRALSSARCRMRSRSRSDELTGTRGGSSSMHWPLADSLLSGRSLSELHALAPASFRLVAASAAPPMDLSSAVVSAVLRSSADMSASAERECTRDAGPGDKPRARPGPDSLSLAGPELASRALGSGAGAAPDSLAPALPPRGAATATSALAAAARLPAVRHGASRFCGAVPLRCVLRSMAFRRFALGSAGAPRAVLLSKSMSQSSMTR